MKESWSLRDTVLGDVLVMWWAAPTPEGARPIHPSTVERRLADWLDHPASRGPILAAYRATPTLPLPLVVGAHDLARTRELIAKAFHDGLLVAFRMPAKPVAVGPRVVRPAAEALGPISSPPPLDEFLRVLLFDATGAPIPSADDAFVVTFDVAVPGVAGPIAEGRAIDNGVGDADGIPPGTVSMCAVTFHVPPDSIVSASSGEPADAVIARSMVRGPLLETRRLTRAELASAPVAASLGATNVLQLRRREATVVECEHFTDGGVLFLPGHAPVAVPYRAAVTDRPSGIEVLEECLSIAQEFPPGQTLVTGHGADVSQKRADALKALLVGDEPSRTAWNRLAVSDGTTLDQNHCLQWAHDEIGWPCAPDTLDAADNGDAVRGFQESYDAEMNEGRFHPPRPKLADAAGVFGAETWGAMFDCVARVLHPPPASDGSPGYIIVDDKHQTYPVALADIAAPYPDSSTRKQHWTDLNALNPGMVIPNGGGWYPVHVGQKIFIPDDWSLDALGPAGAGYPIVPRVPPSPPPRRTPPALAADVIAQGCGAHHPNAPFVDGDERRTTTRAAEVLFFGADDVPTVVCDASSADPCTSDTCELYDPREYEFDYDSTDLPLRDPKELAIRIVVDGGPDTKPLADRPFRLVVDDRKRFGRTDADGFVRAVVPGAAKSGVLTIGYVDEDGKKWDVWTVPLVIAELPPPETLPGATQRLKNLGLHPGSVPGLDDDRTTRAIERFRVLEHIPIGERGAQLLDVDTVRKLKERYGS